MAVEGTIINGMVVLDTGAQLPEGTRVRVQLADEDDDVFPPPEPYDREKELAILREALEDVKADRGIEAREFMKMLATELNLPLAPGEE